MKGQIIVLFGVALMFLLVLSGLILDGGFLFYRWWEAQERIDADTCGVAAGATVNSPATFLFSNGSVYGTYSGTTPTFLLQLVGLEPNDDSQANDDTGNEFSGVCFPWYQGQDVDFDPHITFSPATTGTSPQANKDLIKQTLLGEITAPLPDVGVRVAHVNGVSNNQLVKAALDAGWEVGDVIAVLLFNGDIEGKSPWENIQITGYALFQIDQIEKNYLIAHFQEYVSTSELLSAVRVQQVAYDYSTSATIIPSPVPTQTPTSSP